MSAATGAPLLSRLPQLVAGLWPSGSRLLLHALLCFLHSRCSDPLRGWRFGRTRVQEFRGISSCLSHRVSASRWFRLPTLRSLAAGVVETNARCLAELLDTTRHGDTCQRCFFSLEQRLALLPSDGFPMLGSLSVRLPCLDCGEGRSRRPFHPAPGGSSLGVELGPFGVERTLHLL